MVIVNLNFSEQIAGMLAKEVYTLGRRNAMLFAPDVKGKEIIIRASVTKAEDKPLQGFIAGQGDNKTGYALYIQRTEKYSWTFTSTTRQPA